MLVTILTFILTIGILVIIHELGHFFAAKKFNIKVLEFGFGLPPRLFGKKFGETIFSLNWLPFGGFVHLLGEDETDDHLIKDPRSYANAPAWKRIIVVIAGVSMNLLLAFVLYTIVVAAQNFKVEIPLIADHQFVGVTQTNQSIIMVEKVATDSPAQVSGIKASERIESFNGQKLTNSEDLVQKTKQFAGSKITLEIADTQKTSVRKVDLIPRRDPPPGQGALGISLGSFEVATLEYKTPIQKVFSGPIHAYNLASYSLNVLSEVVGNSFKTRDFRPLSQTVAGPVGITSIVGEILKVSNPLIPLLDFVAALSLNLAIVNILPFPGLDGGRLFFLVIEAITNKKPNPTFEKYLHMIGLVLLLSLIILVTLSDIRKLFI